MNNEKCHPDSGISYVKCKVLELIRPLFIIHYSLLTVYYLLFSACTGNFEEFNRHPTDPSPDDLAYTEQVGILFPGMLRLMHISQENDNQRIMQMVGNQYGGYMVTTNKWNNRNFGTFNPTEEDIAQPFTKIFHRFYANYFQVRKLTESSGYFYGWANIIRVAVMLKVADTYGPIPYSNASVMSSEYDSVQELYRNMIDDLTNSIATLKGFCRENPDGEDGIISGIKYEPAAEYDVVYQGDISKWIKFANSLKLRIAVRMALVDTDYAVKVMENAINDGVILSNYDNAYLPSNDNPYRKAAFDWFDLAVSATLSAYMNGWKDPRLPVYMTMTSDGTYRGVRMGISNINKENYGSTLYSKPNFGVNSPMLVYCAAESYFLMAEAALRGWISGNAKDFYEQGIMTSMNQYNVPIGDYLSVTSNPEIYEDPFDDLLYFDLSNVNSGGNVTVAWDSATSDAEKLEIIITQKWIANYTLGFEAWSDFRRTNYPRLMPAVHNLSSDELKSGWVNNTNIMTDPTIKRMARRLPYPASEYNENYENVIKAVNEFFEGKDEFRMEIWWEKL